MHEWQQAFGWRAGRALQLGTRGRYPLALTRSSGTVAPRIVLLGNAAQSLHPVAGQGFNLALRDAATLAEHAGRRAGRGHRRGGLARAVRCRTRRPTATAWSVSPIRWCAVFGSRHPAVMAARDAGLLLFDLLPPAKRALSRVSLGFGRQAPRLARGIAPGGTR